MPPVILPGTHEVAGVRQFVEGLRTDRCIVVAVFQAQGDIREEHLDEVRVIAEEFRQFPGIQEHALLEHRRAARAQVAEDPDPKVGRRCADIPFPPATVDVPGDDVVDGAAGEQLPIRVARHRDFNPLRRVLPQRGDGSGDQQQVHPDGESPPVPEYQAVTDLAREGLVKRIIAFLVGIGSGELDKTVDADFHPVQACRFSVSGFLVQDADPSGRGEGFLIRPGLGHEQVFVAGQPERLALHSLPVDVFRPGRRVMLRDVTVVQDLEPYAGREGKTGRDHRVLPGDPVLPDLRILIIVSLPDDAVVQGMVDQFQAERLQALELCLILREEADIDVRRPQVQPRGLLRIERTDSQIDVIQGIGIREFFSQHDHVVPDAGQVDAFRAVRLPAPVGTGDKPQQGQQLTKFLHSSQSFSPGQKYGELSV